MCHWFLNGLKGNCRLPEWCWIPFLMPSHQCHSTVVRGGLFSRFGVSQIMWKSGVKSEKRLEIYMVHKIFWSRGAVPIREHSIFCISFLGLDRCFEHCLNMSTTMKLPLQTPNKISVVLRENHRSSHARTKAATWAEWMEISGNFAVLSVTLTSRTFWLLSDFPCSAGFFSYSFIFRFWCRAVA